MQRFVSSAALLIGVGTLIQTVFPPEPLLVWNATASAPIGLYYRVSGGAKTNDWVLVRAPADTAKLAAARGYFPQNVALVKRMAAQVGDTVCRTGRSISINGQASAQALDQDAKDRKLPQWSGCVTLDNEQIFVLAPAASSFDGRYFGPIPRANIVERIAPLWTF